MYVTIWHIKDNIKHVKYQYKKLLSAVNSYMVIFALLGGTTPKPKFHMFCALSRNYHTILKKKNIVWET